MIHKHSLSQQKISDIVAWNYQAADVFQHYGIDFCCNGKTRLRDACHKKQVPIDKIVQQLMNLEKTYTSRLVENYHEWDPESLVDYLKNNHHHFVKTKSGEIETYCEKVANVYGKRHPESVSIFHAFVGLDRDLFHHLQTEETRTFSLITKISRLKKENRPVPADLRHQLSDELQGMESEHEHAMEIMGHIRHLSNDFTPPPEACTTYRMLYQKLEEFESNLKKLVHIENNILFQKAESLIA